MKAIKLLAGAVLAVSTLTAFAQGDQRIVNPYTRNDIWTLSKDQCAQDRRMGTIYQDGRAYGCWGTEAKTDNEQVDKVWLLINGKVSTLSRQQIASDEAFYNAGRTIPWQTLVEINNAYRTPAPAYTPPRNTYYYAPGGDYVGRSTTY